MQTQFEPYPTDWLYPAFNVESITSVAAWRNYVRDRHEFADLPEGFVIDRPTYEELDSKARRKYDRARLTWLANLPKHETPQTADLFDTIDKQIRVNTYSRDQGPRPSIFLSALSGHGKSTLIRELAANYEDAMQEAHARYAEHTQTPVDLFIPVLWVSLPTDVTVKSFAMGMVAYYGEPANERDTQVNLARKARNLIAECGTRLIVIDDITRMQMHREADQSVSDFIRELQETGATVVGVGVDIENSGLLTEGKYGEKRDLKTQTRRRFSLHTLKPFTYDSPENITVWLAHLSAVEQTLPFVDDPTGTLTGDDMAVYLFERTGGVIGSLTSLIQKAGADILGRKPAQGGEVLTMNDFENIVLDHSAESDRTFKVAVGVPDKKPARKSATRRKPRVYSTPRSATA